MPTVAETLELSRALVARARRTLRDLPGGSGAAPAAPGGADESGASGPVDLSVGAARPGAT
jgi:hypothetical protein